MSTTTRRAVLAGAASVPIATIAASSALGATANDGELLALGKDWRAAYETRSTAWPVELGDPPQQYEDANSCVDALAQDIAAIPATTLAGLRIKAEACYDETRELDFAYPVTEEVAASLVQDVLVMTGGEFSGRALAAEGAAASVPIAAAVACSPALADGDDAELLRLAAEVKAAYDGLGVAIDVQSVADKRLFRWRDTNPKGFSMDLIDDASADSDARATAAWDEWRQREAAFKRESGCDEADAAEGVASDKLSAAIDALCNTRARSLRGLSAKARLYEIDPDALGYRMGPSIIDDLCALDAGHV
jgi:hypothetical protein